MQETKIENIINMVETSIQKGLAQQSNVESWIHDIRSFSTPQIRNLLNNLGQNVSTYLEIGTFHGGTLCSTACGNKLNAYAFDIFNEFINENPSDKLESNLKRLNHPSIKFTNKDCWNVDKNDIPELIDLYLYDGYHGEKDQEKALTYFLPFMSDVFILMVDDFNGETVKKGTRSGLELLKDKIIIEKEWEFHTAGNMMPIWWNGFYIAVISKIK